MRVRKRLRRLKRLAYLGALIGVAFAVRQAKVKRAVGTHIGPPPAWPPLQVAEPPVAAVGDLVTAADHRPAADAANSLQEVAPAATEREELAQSDEPVAAIGEVAADPVPWVAPNGDGACPLSHPVKVNANSGIYHLPGGRFYDRTRAERCYVDAAAAEADGYRAAKGS